MEVRKVYQKCRRPSSEIQEVLFENDNNSIVTESYVSGSEDKINIVVVWRVQSKDYFGMTGLMAALEKGRLVVVKRDCLASGR